MTVLGQDFNTSIINIMICQNRVFIQSTIDIFALNEHSILTDHNIDYSGVKILAKDSQNIGRIGRYTWSPVSTAEQGLSEAPLYSGEVIRIALWWKFQPWFPHLVQDFNTSIINIMICQNRVFIQSTVGNFAL